MTRSAGASGLLVLAVAALRGCASATPAAELEVTLAPATVDPLRKVFRRTPEPSEDGLLPLSGHCPDPLLESAAVDVPRDCAARRTTQEASDEHTKT